MGKFPLGGLFWKTQVTQHHREMSIQNLDVTLQAPLVANTVLGSGAALCLQIPLTTL